MYAAANSAKSLLIVDDDASLRRMLCWAIGDIGYFTQGAGDAASTIGAVKGPSFSSAPIYYHLPDGDGPTLAPLLKHYPPQLRPVSTSTDRTRSTPSCPATSR